MKIIVIIVLVVGVIVGLLFTLRTSRNAGTPSPDVLKRAKERERSQQAADKDD